MSTTVTIRTTNNNDQDVINITLEVEDGEILNMYGEDNHGHPWTVDRILFNLSDPVTELEASRCCTRQGGITVCMDC